MGDGFDQKPSPSLCFADSVLYQTGCGEIAKAIANGVSGVQPDNELLVISAELGKHVVGPHRALVVVAESLMPRNFAAGAECVGCRSSFPVPQSCLSWRRSGLRARRADWTSAAEIVRSLSGGGDAHQLVGRKPSRLNSRGNSSFPHKENLYGRSGLGNESLNAR